MTTAKNVTELKKASKNATAKLVAENTESNVINNSNSLINDAELLEQLSKIGIEKVATKKSNKQQLWKKEVLQSYKTEKTARRILRIKQFNLSKTVVKYAKLNQKIDFNNATKELKDFYIKSLVDIKNYSNISEDSEKFTIIQLAYKFTFSTK